MARGIHQLTAGEVAKARRKGLTLCDGGGLYLQRGSSWIFRYTRDSRTRWLGLGPLAMVDLTAARAAAAGKRKQLFEGQDPIALRATSRAKAVMAKTFREAAIAYLGDNAIKWKNPKHIAQWYMTLLGTSADGKQKTDNNYCKILHNVPVAEIDTTLVLAVLKPIWFDKPETAARLRGRIETVLGWTMVHGLRPEGLNPARWDGHLKNVLPEKGEIREVKHHAALPYQELPAFFAKLKQQPGLAARGLAFSILTATRTGDLIGNDREERPPMKREHVDLRAKVWVIPRTKTNVEHRVPLSDAAILLLTDIFKNYPDDGSGIVFTGDKPGQPMSNGAMLRVRDRMIEQGLIEKGTVTTHGMARAGFKSWASDATNYEKAVIEACLTHVTTIS